MLWSTADGSPQRTLRGHTDVANSSAFLPDGALLASGSYDGFNTVYHITRALQLGIGSTRVWFD